MSNGATPAAEPKRRKALDLPGFLARRGALIGIVGGILALVLIPLLLLVVTPRYVADAVLMLDASKRVDLNGKEIDAIPGDIGDYTRTQIGRMTGVDVLLAALRSIPETNRPAFYEPKESEVHNAILVFKHLTVAEVPRSHLITAKLEAETPRGLGDLLNAVMDSFLSKLRHEQEQELNNRMTYLRDERSRIEEQLASYHARLLELAEKASNKAFLHESYTVHLTKLEQIQRLYWEAEAARAEKEGLLKKAQSDDVEMHKLSMQAYADERVADNFGINRIEQYTYEQLQQMRASVDGLTEDNQDRKYVEERMAAMNKYLEQYKKLVSEDTIRNLVDKREYDLRAAVIKAASDYDAAKLKCEQVGRDLEAARREASDTSEAIFNAAGITYSVGQLRERLTQLNTRIDDCEMTAKAPLKIAIEHRAATPTVPTTNTRPRVLIMAVLLAYGLVTAFCLVFELLDGRVRSRRELGAALGGPGPEPIPEAVGADAGRFARIVREVPESAAACALRSLAVRLERERRLSGGNVVLIAGAGPSAGTSSIAANLADALAGVAGRILLVVIGGTDAAVASTSVSGVSRACIAASGMDARSRLRELIGSSRGAFDYVLIDAPPLHASDISQFAALDCSAAIIVVREDRAEFRDVVFALDVLRAAKVPALTAVLNCSTRTLPCCRVSVLQRGLAGLSRVHSRVGEWVARRRAERKSGRDDA